MFVICVEQDEMKSSLFFVLFCHLCYLYISATVTKIKLTELQSAGRGVGIAVGRSRLF